MPLQWPTRTASLHRGSCSARTGETQSAGRPSERDDGPSHQLLCFLPPASMLVHKSLHLLPGANVTARTRTTHAAAIRFDRVEEAWDTSPGHVLRLRAQWPCSIKGTFWLSFPLIGGLDWWFARAFPFLYKSHGFRSPNHQSKPPTRGSLVACLIPKKNIHKTKMQNQARWESSSGRRN